MIAASFMLLIAQEGVSVNVDLAVGEVRNVEVTPGKFVQIKLYDLDEFRDGVNGAVRDATMKVDIDSTTVMITSGNYRLPVTTGSVQVDCPITKGYIEKGNRGNIWALQKDARIRLWPRAAPLLPPATFAYPVRQRWFASATQMANEPVWVDGGEKPGAAKIYYHYGLDIGGAEGRVDVLSATDGIVVSSGTTVLPDLRGTPVSPRYDVIYTRDDRGWYYRYSHLKVIDPSVKIGERVHLGQKIGVLGKEGGSGGWSHLHFDISRRQPSGDWGIEEGYAYLWEAYVREYKPHIMAVARPHQVGWAGEDIILVGSHSWAEDGISSYDWTFTDGTTADRGAVLRNYPSPGRFSEILKVTDKRGRISYDFAIVEIHDKSEPRRLPPTLHAAYAPTQGIKPGDAVTFKVRTFRTTDGAETLDPGDGSPVIALKSDGNVKPLAPDGYAETVHKYERPGHYVVRVQRTNAHGVTAYAHLYVEVTAP